MRIIIKNQSLSKNIIEQSEVRWKIHFQKIKKALTILGALSIVFLIVGISSGNKYTMMNTGVKKIYFNLNIYTSLGISSILVLLYVIRQVFISKKNFLNAGREVARKFEAIDEIIYEFNESEVIIDKKLQYEKINWNLFSTKIFYNKFIFLNYSSKVVDGISIDGRFFSESDFIAIKELIDKKIK